MISDEDLIIISESKDFYMGVHLGDMAKELLALRKGRDIPEGWRLVPVEPTRQMMSQGHFALGGTDRGKFRRIYQAMLTAGPEPE